MSFIYFYIFCIFYICVYILLIYSRAILSFPRLTGYATRSVVLLILCVQIVLLPIIIIIIIIITVCEFQILIAEHKCLTKLGD